MGWILLLLSLSSVSAFSSCKHHHHVTLQYQRKSSRLFETNDDNLNSGVRRDDAKDPESQEGFRLPTQNLAPTPLGLDKKTTRFLDFLTAGPTYAVSFILIAAAIVFQLSIVMGGGSFGGDRYLDEESGPSYTMFTETVSSDEAQKPFDLFRLHVVD
mmetsp:Transcript_32647/g.66653  ORF Transcript_32647/g.66653 Transcript_32647/m.66653 type:complete len:157 (-) Transcript_32647:388-858(-)